MKENPLVSRSDVHIVPTRTSGGAALRRRSRTWWRRVARVECRQANRGVAEADVRRRLKEIIQRFGRRHRDIVAIFSQHAERVSNRLDPKEDLSEERWLLLGASFTHEYSLEAAAVCNPSIVLHPDQSTYRKAPCDS